MKRLLAASLLLAFCSLPALAEDANSPPVADAQKVALGEDIFDLFIAKQDIQTRMTAVIGAMFRNEDSKAQSAATAVTTNVGQVVKDMLPEMRQAYGEAYARHFSLGELQTIKTFYQSPAGVELLSQTQAISIEVMQAIGPELMSRIKSSMPVPPQSQPQTSTPGSKP